MTDRPMATDEEIAKVRAALDDLLTPLPWAAGGNEYIVGGPNLEDVAEAPDDVCSAIATVMNAAPSLLSRIEQQDARIAEMEGVLGPKCACGHYAVEHVTTYFGYQPRALRCGECRMGECHLTPEYAAWRAERSKG